VGRGSGRGCLEAGAEAVLAGVEGALLVRGTRGLEVAADSLEHGVDSIARSAKGAHGAFGVAVGADGDDGTNGCLAGRGRSGGRLQAGTEAALAGVEGALLIRRA